MPWSSSNKSPAVKIVVPLLTAILLVFQVIGLPVHIYWFFAILILLLMVALWFLFKLSPATWSGPGLLFFLAGAAFTLIVVKNAWVADDAYVTFRTVENFIHGLGLTWNPTERVQTFTHPLWLLIISFIRLISGKIYFSSIFISIVFTLVTIVLLVSKIARNHFTAITAIMLLSFSKAFVDFSTSGLENPLTYLCLAGFYAYYWQAELKLKNLFWLCLLASLGALSRLDTILFFIPALAVATWQMKDQPKWNLLGASLAGFSPLLLWELFTFIYYGFLLPNPAYAKLYSGIAASQLVVSGFYYVLNSLQNDPITLVAIFGGITLPVFIKNKKSMLLALGIVLYLIYIVRIGGDFMSGRLFAAPMLCAVMLLSHGLGLSLKQNIVALGLVFFFGQFSPLNPWASGADYRKADMESLEAWSNNAGKPFSDSHQIEDERGYYFQATGLLLVSKEDELGLKTNHPIRATIKQGKELASSNQRRIIVGNRPGIEGYYAGPKIHFLDITALGDPLLARMPVKQNSAIGRYEREIPFGYVDSIISGKNQITNPQIAALYDKLKIATQGQLLNVIRLATLVPLNFQSETLKLSTLPAKLADMAVDERVFSVLQGTDAYSQFMSQGLQATKHNDWNQALELWEKALEINRERPEAWGNIGIIHEIKGNPEKALEYYRHAAEKQPKPWADYAQKLEQQILKNGFQEL